MPYIGQRPTKGDENNFKILDDISSYTLTFDGSDSSVVSAANDTITSLTHRFVQGQRVTYNKGGGTVIAGLSDGVYYIIKEDHNTIKLATSASNATNGIAVNITGVGAGSSHTLNVAFDGINTKFKATHTNGQKARITRSAQLVISINGVIQQPHDTATPSTGFGFDLDGTIVFSQAPVSTDEYWAHVLTNNNVSFEISDNDIDNFTGDGSTTEFNLSKSPPDNRNVLVTIDGVVQYPNDPDGTARAYVVVENVLTFNSAPASGVEIQVRHIGFAGSTSGSGGVTSFYGRTGAVVLKNTDNIVANNAEFAGNLTVQGTMTTLDTVLTEVDKLEVGANNTSYAGIITQTGSGKILGLFDGSTEVFTVKDGGNVGINSTAPETRLDVIESYVNKTWTPSTSLVSLFERNGISKIGIVAAANSYSQIDFGDPNDDNVGYIRYQHHDNSMLFRTNASEKLRITNTGDVGIGTTNPYTTGAASKHKLTVAGDDVLGIGRQNNDMFYVRREYEAGKYTFQTINGGNDGNFNFQPFGGAVGIGTKTPATKLHVYHSTTNGVALFQSGDAYCNLILQDSNSNTSSKPQFGVKGDDFRFVSYDGSSATEKLRIKADGSVGIGTDDPSALLTVGGDEGFKVPAVGTIIANRNIAIQTVYPIIQFIDTDSNSDFQIQNANGKFGIRDTTNSKDRLVIKSDGKVGIGTDDPDQLLELVGTDPKLKIHDRPGGATHALEIGHDGTEGLINLRSAGFLKIVQSNGTSNGITFHTNNTQIERFRINGEGRVGVGTTNPSQRFTVEGNGTATGGILVQNVTYGNNQNRPYLTVGTSNWDGSTTNWGTHGFQHRIKSNSGGSARITIDSLVSGSTKEIISISSGGRVGLGTDNSKGILHLRGSDHDGLISNIDIDGDYEFGSIGVNMYRNTSDTGSNHTGWSKANDLRTGAAIEFETHTNAYASLINFYLAAKGPYSNSNWVNQKIGIWDSTGLIISTEADKTPNTNSRGNAAFYVTSNDVQTARFRCGNAGNTMVHIECSTNTGDSELHFCDLADRTGGGATHYESSSGEIVYEHDNDAFRFNTNSSEKFRIDSDGNLIHTSVNKTLSLVSTQNVNSAGTKIAFFGANRYTTDEEFAAIKGGLTSNSGGSGKQSGYLEFVVGANSHKVRITDAGKVGINTNIPQSRLHVFQGKSGFDYGTTGQLIVENDSGSTVQILAPSTHSSSIHFGDNDNGMVGRIQYEHEHNQMSFWNSNLKRMTLDGTNVGIGITNPGATLHVVNGSDASIRIFDSTGAVGDLSSSGWKFRALAGNASNPNALQIYYGTTEKIHITTDGNIGIGTDAPENDIHVKTGSATMKLTSTASSNSSRLILESEDNSYGGVHFGDPSDEDVGRIRYYHGGSSPNHMIFYTNATDVMRIDGTGRVRIGSDNSTEYSINSDSNAILQLSHSAGPKLIMARVDTGVGSGDDLGVIDFHSTDQSNALVARMEVQASQSHSNTNKGTDFRFYTTKNNTATQREVVRINDTGALTLNATNTSDNAILLVSSEGVETRHNIANQSAYTFKVDSHHTGGDALSGGRARGGAFFDVECGITTGSNTPTTQRIGFYGTRSHSTASKYVYTNYASYNLAQMTKDVDNQAGSNTVIGTYGYAQGYQSGGTNKTANIYGGYFLGYRGGDVNAGHCFGVHARAHNQSYSNTTNANGNTGDMTGVYAECEQDQNTTIGNMYAFRGHLDLDAGSVTTGYMFYGSFAGDDNFTNRRGIWVEDATDNILGGDLSVGGNVTANGSKPFRISHPLVGLSTTKDLVHTAIEGPQVDLIYRGKTTLVAGISTVNLDTKSGMTEGTFVALNRDVQCFTTNETGWTNVKGSVTGNQLTIIAQENTCTDTISWMVIGERQDDAIKASTLTDADGKLILEPDRRTDLNPKYKADNDADDLEGDELEE